MSIIATAVKHLIAAGVTGDALVAAIADLEAQQCTAPKDAAAEKRRAWDRDRKRKKRGNGSDVSGGIPVDRVESIGVPNDIYSNPPVSPSAKADCPQLAGKVVEAWNDLAARHPALSPARSLTPQRRKHLAARVKQSGEEAVFEAICNVGLSDWHSGRKSDWHADLGWLLKSPENFQKLLEIKPGKSVPDVSKPASETERQHLENFKAKERGEITDEQYWQRRAELDRSCKPPASRMTPQRPGPTAFGDLMSRITSNGVHH